MARSLVSLSLLLVTLLAVLSPGDAWGQQPAAAIVCASDAGPAVQLAAKEVRRYVYLCSDLLLPIRDAVSGPANIVIAAKGSPLLRPLIGNAAIDKLVPESYCLKTVTGSDGHRTVYLIGGSDLSTLYAAYRFAEVLGVRFYLHGDVLPDTKAVFGLPDLDEEASPLFHLRGIQPFHDFPEGPDWWSGPDYRAILAQLPKLRMNFFGLHTYPEDRPSAEPGVWIGQKEDILPGGKPAFAYPAIWYNTVLAVNWGYQPKKTGDYACGAAALFDRDDFGSEIMRGLTPRPDSPEQCVEVFDRAGTLFRDAFAFAHSLGIKTCIGTETPLVVPKRVKERIAPGAEPTPEQIEKLYEGIFTRIAQTHPVDYYWFWTPENWTWEGVKPEVVQKTTDDLKLARTAWEAVKPPFQLATCGWVLGPQNDRAYLDRVLPKDMAVSCINRAVGHDPVEPGFAKVEGRGKWAIPWLEDDPAMSSPQLWVGRMRRDARDALKYGCTGLMGIHWRTRILAPNVLALAQAGWEQGEWPDAETEESGVIGGSIVTYPNAALGDIPNAAIYKSVRFDLSGYRLVVPNGDYHVILQFCEPHYNAPEKRVFNVLLQDKPVIENLDIFAKVGKDHPLDYPFEITVTNERIAIDFGKVTEFPCIAGIVVQGTGLTLKVNCGGEASGDYVADLKTLRAYPRADDFYADWARAEFGPEAGPEVAAIFSRIDGDLPRPSNWIGGPGGYDPDKRPWDEVQKEYVFVDELQALRGKVAGKGNLERFDYWLNTLAFLRDTGHMRCLWAEYNQALAQAKRTADPAARKQAAKEVLLPRRLALVSTVSEAYSHLLATVNTYGEMGTVCNLEQHTLPALLDAPGKELADMLGEPLPAEASLSLTYAGSPRLIVRARSSLLRPGDPLEVKATLLDKAPAQSAALHWRPLGTKEFRVEALKCLARQTYGASLSSKEMGGKDLEYYVQFETSSGQQLQWPPTAPQTNLSVVQQAGL